MNKKGQNISFDNPVGAIFGFLVLMAIAVPLLTIISNAFSTIGQDQCKPIQEKADQLQLQVNADQQKINEINGLLEQCRVSYEDLANQTITRKDFEEVKGYFNLTSNEISTINKKIDGINRVYNLYNINIKNYSFALNIVLFIEFFSFALLKNEFLQWVWSITLGKRKKKKEETEKKDG